MDVKLLLLVFGGLCFLGVVTAGIIVMVMALNRKRIQPPIHRYLESLEDENELLRQENAELKRAKDQSTSGERQPPDNIKSAGD